MAILCPTVLATTEEEYNSQIKLATNLTKRIQVDLMDGVFAPSKSVGFDKVWWPADVHADVHLMYQNPHDYLDQLIKLKPHMVIIHAEADAHHMHFAAELHKHDIKAGIAILADTTVDSIEQIIHSFDHILVFGGKLGYFGGQPDLGILSKVDQIKEHHPDVEIGWDGGVSDQNAKQLAEGGIDVLNAGGYIQKADNPQANYDKIMDLIGKAQV
ncbi:MAG: hypothetical protein AAB914_04525 [Patescibacteria group bacterium]